MTRRALRMLCLVGPTLAALAAGALAAPGDVFSAGSPGVELQGPAGVSTALSGHGVSEQTGAFSYRFPIVVPPGRQGMQPSLALSYDSNGPVRGGIASQWTLDVPDVRRDLSAGRLMAQGAPATYATAWQSSLGGGAPLVRITEPGVDTGYETYRAQGDGSYTRYRRMPASAPWRWEARATDGTIYRFGETSLVDGGDVSERAPLTSVRDRFGNTVTYEYVRVSAWGGAEELALREVRYSANAAANLPDHARVTFDWGVAPSCAGSVVPVGAAIDFRSSRPELRGARRLRKILVDVRDQPSGAYRRVREIELGYDQSAESCAGATAPVRVLQSIRERAFAPGGATVETPPLTFAYGAVPAQPAVNAPISLPDKRHAEALSWGRDSRGVDRPREENLTMTQMLVDLDGDGLRDRLVVQSATLCTAALYRNTGAGFAFQRVISLPEMPWGDDSTCSLLGQFGRPVTPTLVPPSSRCTERNAGTGTRNTFRFLDVNGDGLLDLVTAIEHDAMFYDPACDAGVPNDDATSCASAAPGGGDDGDICENYRVPQRSGGDYIWRWYENRGGRFDATPRIRRSPIPVDGAGADSFVGRPGYTASTSTSRDGFYDLDGDGFLDAIKSGGVPAGTWHVFRGDGTGNFHPRPDGTPYEWQTPPVASLGSTVSLGGYDRTVNVKTALADINGDGLLDLVTPDGTAPQLLVYFNHGAGFRLDPLIVSQVEGNVERMRVESEEWEPIYGELAASRRYRLRTLDFDGDGLEDLLLRVGAGNYRVYFNSGTRFVDGGYTFTTDAFGDDALSGYAADDGEWRTMADVVDIDGDGVADWWSDGRLRARPAAAAAPRLLHTIDNGRGAEIRVDYAPVASDLVADLADRMLPHPLWVTREVRLVTNDDTGDAVTSYFYERPRYGPDDRGRYGFRGFESVTTTHPEAQPGGRAVTVATIRYDLDFRGLPVETMVVDGDGRLQSVTAVAWQVHALFDGRVRSYQQTERRQWTCRPSQVVGSELADQAAACRADGLLSREIVRWTPMKPELPSLIFVPPSMQPRAVSTRELTAVTTASNDLRTTEPTPLVVAQPTVHGEGIELDGREIAPDPAAGASLYVADSSRLTDVEGPVVAGDRGASMLYRLLSRNDTYLLLAAGTGSFVATSPGSIDAWGEVEVTGQTEIVYDEAGFGVPHRTSVWLDDETVATTVQAFDTRTGNTTSIVRPNEVASPDTERSIRFWYDAHAIYPTLVMNELGHQSYTVTDHGTGKPTVVMGPYQPGRGWPTDQRELDGFGRTLRAWRSFNASTGSGYSSVLVYQATYDDAAGVARVEELVDQSADTWTSTTLYYDGAGRVTTEVEATETGPAATSYAYDPAGNVVSVVMPSPRSDAGVVAFHYDFDALGRVVEFRPPIGAVTRLTYDGPIVEREQLVADDSAPGYERLAHDAFGRLVAVTERTDAGEATTVYEYDANDNVERIVDADGVETTLEHDLAGRRIALHRPAAIGSPATHNTWRYFYDLHGNLVGELAPHVGDDQPGDPTAPLYLSSWTYDAVDRVTSYRPAPRNLSSLDRARLGVGVTTYHYDDTARENGMGRLTRVTMPYATFEYDYEARGLVTREQMSLNVQPSSTARLTTTLVARHDYNAMGLPTRTEHADGAGGPATTTVTGYDRRGLPIAVRAGRSTEPAWTYRVLDELERGRSGVPRFRRSAAGGAQTWSYDDLGRVTDHRIGLDACATANAPCIPTPLGGETVGYEDKGNVRSLRYLPTGLELEMGYDAQHQLTTVTSSDLVTYAAGFTYSPAGRILTSFVGSRIATTDVEPRDVEYIYGESWTADRGDVAAPRALINVGEATPGLATGAPLARYTYGPTGNLEHRTIRDETWRFVYDGNDELREVRKQPTGERETYYYDANRQRIVAYTAPFGTEPGRFRVWFGAAELEYTATGAPTSSKVYVSLGAQPVARIDDRNLDTPTSLYSNGLGHLLTVLTADGTVAARFTYGPFGEILSSEGAAAADYDRRFNGKQFDDISRLSYYGYRYYDRLSQTFSQADPLYRFAPDAAWDDPRRAQLYAFSLNNPLRYVDLDGLDGTRPDTEWIYRTTCRMRPQTEGCDRKKKRHNAPIGGEDEENAEATGTGDDDLSGGGSSEGDPNGNSTGGNYPGEKLSPDGLVPLTNLIFSGFDVFTGLGKRIHAVSPRVQPDTMKTIEGAMIVASVLGPAATALGRAAKAGPKRIRRIYEHNPKHRDIPYKDSKGRTVSRRPRGDCQAMLNCSVQKKPNSPSRVGVEPSTGKRVEFRRHLVQEFANEIREYFHGYVPDE